MPTDVNAIAFKELRELLDGKRLNKAFKTELGLLAVKVDSIIRSRVFEVYKVDQAKLRSISNVAGRANVETLGTSIFKTSILYKHKPTPLAPFQVDERFGNINKAYRKGLMEFVSIKRVSGNRVSRGYEHRGGFIPRRSSINYMGEGKGFKKTKQKKSMKLGGFNRTNLYERKGASRLSKLRLLFAPSPAQMVGYIINNDLKVMEQIEVVSNTAIDNALNLYYKGK
jgi:hypothetical protein